MYRFIHNNAKFLVILQSFKSLYELLPCQVWFSFVSLFITSSTYYLVMNQCLLGTLLVLEPDKKASAPLLYHLCFIVGLAEGDLPSWYQSQEVSSLSPDDSLIPLRVIFTYKSPVGLV
jgi:hypothetical protein